MCYYFDSHGNAEYFDPYGLPPANCELFQFFERNGKNHKCNKIQLQGMKTTVCGHWCIAFLGHRARGHSMTEIIKRFKGKEPGHSDKMVGKLVKDAFNIQKIKTSVQDGGHFDNCVQCCCSRVHRKRNCHAVQMKEKKK